VFKSTLGDLPAIFSRDPSTRIFVKPAAEAKAFSGECISSEFAGDSVVDDF
jgi:hypothetical protein